VKKLIEYLLPVGIGVFGGIAALLFFKFKKPAEMENPLVVTEDIPEERQPLIIFAGGKRVNKKEDEEVDYGMPYVGKIFWRKKYKDSLDLKVKNLFSNTVFELNPVVNGTNLVLPDDIDLTGGQVILFCNIDAANRVCEWNFTTAKKYVQQLSDITKASIEASAIEKAEKTLEKKITHGVFEDISVGETKE